MRNLYRNRQQKNSNLRSSSKKNIDKSFWQGSLWFRPAILALLVLGILAPIHPVGAQSNNEPDEFPPNPLELKTPDPLLPNLTGTSNTAKPRPLTELERQQLAIALDGLNAQATALFNAGDRLGALETWNRELRLRRFLGLLEEIPALGRVGSIAWQENQTPELRWITQRLDAIWAQTKPTKPTEAKPSDPKPAAPAEPAVNQIAVLEALGLAYQQVRSPVEATDVYQQILADARERKDAKKIETTLLTLAQIHLDWFNYPKAAEAYQELFTAAKAKGDRPNEITYLSRLAHIYEEAKLPEQAIPYEQQLLEIYQQMKTSDPMPALQIRIADNFQKIGRLDQAEKYYQAAYQLAQPLLQFGYASDALKKLGVLYRTNNLPEAALRVYNFLIGVEQQAYNVYGMMNAYDQIGQIELDRKAYPQASAAFQKGLALARQLRYREDYFISQIQRAAQQGAQ